MSTTLDVTREIKLDHDNVRDLFERYQAATDQNEKAKLANTLIREMAIHGDAEESSVYNDYSNVNLADTAAHNKEEHAQIKRLVHEADSKSISDPNYDVIVTRAVNTFLAHAKEEEDVEHPIIRQKLSSQDNNKVARLFLEARKKVPTRQQLGREFATLKYTHPEF